MKLLLTLLLALCAGCAGATPSAEEERVITALIEQVDKAPSMKFMRNGSTHDGPEAATHLGAKYKHFKDEIVTAEDFIRLCATRSEMTRQSYRVRIGDAEPRDADSFLLQALKKLRAASKG